MNGLKKISVALLMLMGSASAMIQDASIAQENSAPTWEHRKLKRLGCQWPLGSAKRGGVEEYIICRFGRNVLTELDHSGKTRISTFPIGRIIMGKQPKEVFSKHPAYHNRIGTILIYVLPMKAVPKLLRSPQQSNSEYLRQTEKRKSVDN